MELAEDEIIEKYAKQSGHCKRNTSPLYWYEWTCVSRGFNSIKRRLELL